MKIFISYRRDDSSGYAGRLYDRLAGHFGRSNVFMDIEALEPGMDFVDGIDQAMAACGALVVLIGTRWLSATDAEGRPRLDNANDFIRLEVATALRRGLSVLPVLVNGAAMPRVEELPTELAPLARRQAQELSNTRWDYDVGRLIDALEHWLDRTSGEGATAAGPPPERSEVAGRAAVPPAPAGGARSPAWIWGSAMVLLLGLLSWGAWTWLRDPPAGPPPTASDAPVEPAAGRSVAVAPPAPPAPTPAARASEAQAPPGEPVAVEPPSARAPPADARSAGSESAPAPAVAPPAEPSAPPDTAARVAELLEQAEVDFAADRLTRPSGANAYARYRQVLELAPDHPVAREGLRRLGHRYLDLAAGALERGRRDQAQAYLEQAERFVPDVPELGELRERVAAARPRVEPRPEPPAEPEVVPQCLQACEAAFAGCREAAHAAGGVDACMAQRRAQCGVELDACRSDAQKLFLWGQVGTDSACAGEHHQCIERAAAECETIGQTGLQACEAEAEQCRRRCLGE